MILVDKQIRQYTQVNKIKIHPFNTESINPNSYDLHLGNQFQISIKTNGIDPNNEKTINQAFHPVKLSEIWIQPGEFLLGHTSELITLPADIVGSVEGKSSLARLGLSIHQTGGWVDAGFSGSITLEIQNCNQNPILLQSGMSIAQIVFFQTQCCEIPYGERQSSKYQNQAGATLCRYHKNGERRGL